MNLTAYEFEALLKKYMAHVLREEGSTCTLWLPDDFSELEKNVLTRIGTEVVDEEKTHAR